MDCRTLGTTGIEISTFCLGAMMFGPFGNDDEAECTGMVHTALDTNTAHPWSPATSCWYSN